MIIDPSNLIICYKHKQSTRQRALGIVLPVLFWGILLYVLSTLFALGSSIIDYSHFGNWMGYEDILAIKKIISRYFPVIGGFVCDFLLSSTIRFDLRHTVTDAFPVRNRSVWKKRPDSAILKRGTYGTCSRRKS